MSEAKKLSCVKCEHLRPDHRDDICYGERFCTCIKFEEPVNKIEEKLTVNTGGYVTLQSRTSTPLPQPINLHDNWTGKGWQYQKKWGKTQSEMVEFLALRCGLFKHEIREFLRCNDSSVRGRLSEIRNKF